MQSLSPINLITLERIQKIKKTLDGTSTQELIPLVQKGFQGMKNIPNDGKHYMESALNLPKNHPIYVGRAAYGIIEQREGKEFAMNLIGLRGPKTFFEKIRYSISEIPFPLDSVN